MYKVVPVCLMERLSRHGSLADVTGGADLAAELAATRLQRHHSADPVDGSANKKVMNFPTETTGDSTVPVPM